MTPAVKEFFRRQSDNPRLPLYETYLQSIAAESGNDVFWRFVFAFTSIHSNYESNIRAYQILRNPGAWQGEDTLRQALVAARCGLYNNRARFLWKFAHEFFFGSFMALQFADNLLEKRNMMVERLHGIGRAKTSFALEMSFPTQSEVVCMDVHHLRLYDLSESPTRADYERCERDWCWRSEELGVSPYAMRNVFWDENKGQPSPRFWTFVFEPKLEQTDIALVAGLDFGETPDVASIRTMSHNTENHETKHLPPQRGPVLNMDVDTTVALTT